MFRSTLRCVTTLGHDFSYRYYTGPIICIVAAPIAILNTVKYKFYKFTEDAIDYAILDLENKLIDGEYQPLKVVFNNRDQIRPTAEELSNLALKRENFNKIEMTDEEDYMLRKQQFDATVKELRKSRNKIKSKRLCIIPSGIEKHGNIAALSFVGFTSLTKAFIFLNYPIVIIPYFTYLLIKK